MGGSPSGVRDVFGNREHSFDLTKSGENFSGGLSTTVLGDSRLNGTGVDKNTEAMGIYHNQRQK